MTAWAPTSQPPVHLAIADIPTWFRNISALLDGVIEQDHTTIGGDYGSTPSGGKHKQCTFAEQTSAPTTAENEMALYCVDLGSAPGLYIRPESAGTAVQLTDGTGKIVSEALEADIINSGDLLADDIINTEHIELSDDEYLQAESGDLIKYDSASSSAMLPDGSRLAAEPEAGDDDAVLASKGYVDSAASTAAAAKGLQSGSDATIGKFDGSPSAKVTTDSTFEDLDTGIGEFCIVCLEVYCNTAEVNAAIKPKGYGSSNYLAHRSHDNYSGAGNGWFRLSAAGYAYLCLPTDSNGMLQIASSSDTALFTIKLVGYIV